MTTVQPSTTASTATPDPRAQRVDEPAALYRLYGTDGALLYIGVTDDPDRRFKQHRDSKPWWPQVARKTIEWRPSRAIALAEEAAAIKAEAPVYNIDHNPAAPSYHWPPTGMAADRVDGINREVSKLPAGLAEGIRRAAFEGFMRAQHGQHTATKAFEALVAEHNLTVEEWDTSTLDDDLRDKFYAIYIEKRGRKILAVPIGQDPAHRLAALRAVLAHQGVAA
jgi:predicted GIY-YIG superfamily endonuclease